MSNSIAWNASPSGLVPVPASSKWEEISQGLKLAFLGYIGLLLFGAAAVFLFRMGLHEGKAPAWHLGLSNTDLVVFGWLAVGGAILFGYGLILVGQWRCLVFAPQRFSAKEVLFTSVLCLLLAPTCLVVAHFVGGVENYVVFDRGLQELDRMNKFAPQTMLQLAGGALLLLNLLFFSQFLRIIARCLQSLRRAKLIGCQVWLGYFLMGGVVGSFFLPLPVSRAELMPWVGGGWAACLGCYLIFFIGTLRDVTDSLARGGLSRSSGQPRKDTGSSRKPYSGLHRYMVVMPRPED